MISKRNFIKLAAAGVSAGAIQTFASGPANAQGVRVRRNINAMPADDPILEVFREAVTKMHELPDTDERSWIGQAQIHLDHCHRQPGHFLTWHRQYTLAFEDIVRDVTGEPDWALPYWDWSNNPQIPSAFFGAGNPLDTETWNDPDPQTSPFSQRRIGADDTLSSSSVDISRIENQRLFDVFSSRLDNGPHGSVHVAIGGHMGRFLSPLDPIFWVHHCNVDRIWAKWSLNFANPGDDEWLSETFDDMFVDVSGQFVSDVRASDLVDSRALGYDYDDLLNLGGAIAAGATSTDLSPIFETEAIFTANAIPSVLNIPTSIALDAEPRVLLPDDFFDKQSVLDGTIERRVVARLSEIDIPEDAENYEIRIFLNCPYLSPEVPKEDPHFVAELSLFSLRAMSNFVDMEGMKPSALVDLTETLVNLNLRQTPVVDELDVQIIAVALDESNVSGDEFVVGRVEVVAA
ncbi:MAG: tyrosinase family protein [Planctomycetota bacterium]